MAFLTDTFTDTDGVLLQDHTSDSGHTWAKVAGGGQYQVLSNKLTWSSLYYVRIVSNATPPSATYDVAMVLNKGASSVSIVGILARHVDSNNYYRAYHNNAGTDQYILDKVVGGSITQLDTVTEVFPSGDQNVTFEASDAVKRLLVGAVEKLTTTDNEITAAGGVGLWLYDQATSWTVDSFTASDVGAVEGAAVLSGVGSLAAAAGVTIPGAASLSGVGTIIAAGTTGTIHTGAAVLSGVGSLSPTPALTLGGVAVLSGVGNLVAVGERGALGAAVLAGIGSLSAVGQVGNIVEGYASLGGVGNLSAIGQRLVAGQASLSGVGSFIPAGVIIAVGAASLSGVGSLAAIGETGEILYTQMGKRTFDIDPADYPTGTLFYFEANMETGGTGQIANVRLFNITDAIEVSGSPITIQGPGPAWNRSGNFSLPSEVKRYRVEYGGVMGGIFKPHGAALRVASS